LETRLAAILAADIVGYSRLMGADAIGTLSALKKMRAELFGPTIASYHGNLVKSMGDGWLVEFSSAADAVNCALRLQEGLTDHQIIKLRVGVHIGDIMHEDEDIFGDGVNIAARLQEMSNPGEVAISDFTFSSLDGTLRPAFTDAGEQMFKNIARPVRVWLRERAESDLAAGELTHTEHNQNIGFPQLVVIPIDTSDTRAEVIELAAAVTSDLATYLGSPVWLSSRVSQQFGKSNYCVSAILRARGERLRLEIQLNNMDGQKVWTGKFDGELENCFDWQDKTVEEVTSSIIGQLLDAEKLKLSAKTSKQMTAEECLFYGMLHFADIDVNALSVALKYYDLAIRKKPSLGLAYSMAVNGLHLAISLGLTERVAEYLPKMNDWMVQINRLVTQRSPEAALIVLSSYLSQGDPIKFRQDIEDLLRRMPFNEQVLYLVGWGYIFLGEPQTAIECLSKCERISRFSMSNAVVVAGLAVANIQAGRNQAAVKYAQLVCTKVPWYVAGYRALAAAHAHLGRQDEAALAIEKVLELTPEDSVSNTRQRSRYVDNEATRRYLDGLRLAGLPE